MSSETSSVIRVTRHFEASPERVFDAWLDPQKIAVWLVGPAKAIAGIQDEVLHIEVDARVGGRFSFLVRRNGTEIDHAGEYLEFDPPRRLVFTWGIAKFSGEPSKVSVELIPAGTGTLLTLTATGVAPDYQARTEQGWTTILGAIAASL
ncbi:MAG TPA: SRPBCC family protein [Oscillatoriaceae cyanobacterium]